MVPRPKWVLRAVRHSKEQCMSVARVCPNRAGLGKLGDKTRRTLAAKGWWQAKTKEKQKS